MKLREWMAEFAVKWAADNSHGYTNNYPANQWWQDKLNNDCGSFMSLCLHEALLKIGIDTGYQYFEPQGGWSIYNEAFLLKYCDRYNYADEYDAVGDILVSGGHTEMVTSLNPKKLTGARNDYDGKSGDWKYGTEVATSAYYTASGGWHYIYRLKDKYNKEIDQGTDPDVKEDEIMAKLETLKYGSTGNQVKNLQALLNLWTTQSGALEAIEVDGIFGAETEERLKLYQEWQGLYVDGVCGEKTWADILLS